jgi:hypothetical protein
VNCRARLDRGCCCEFTVGEGDRKIPGDFLEISGDRPEIESFVKDLIRRPDPAELLRPPRRDRAMAAVLDRGAAGRVRYLPSACGLVRPPWYTWGYLGIPGDTRGYFGIPGNTWGYLGIPGDTRGYFGIPGNTRGYFGIPGGTSVTRGYFGIPGDTSAYSGILRHTRGYFGIPGGTSVTRGYTGCGREIGRGHARCVRGACECVRSPCGLRAVPCERVRSRWKAAEGGRAGRARRGAGEGVRAAGELRASACECVRMRASPVRMRAVSVRSACEPGGRCVRSRSKAAEGGRAGRARAGSGVPGAAVNSQWATATGRFLEISRRFPEIPGDRRRLGFVNYLIRQPGPGRTSGELMGVGPDSAEFCWILKESLPKTRAASSRRRAGAFSHPCGRTRANY